MDKYRVITALTLPVGALVELTTQQAEARAHAVEKIGKAYRAKLPLRFKAGEEIGYDGELPKALAQAMTPAGKRKTGKGRAGANDAAADLPDDDSGEDTDADTDDTDDTGRA